MPAKKPSKKASRATTPSRKKAPHASPSKARKPAGKTAARKEAAPARKGARGTGTSAARKSAASARDRGLTVDAYILALPPELSALCTRLLSLVADAAPDATLSIKWGQPVWERHGPFAFLRASKAHVTLGFWRGAQLDDPHHLLEGDGDKMRHVKLTPDGDFPLAALRRFVHEAVAQNALRGDPTKSRA